MDKPRGDDPGGGNSGCERCFSGVKKPLKREFEQRFEKQEIKLNIKKVIFLSTLKR